MTAAGMEQTSPSVDHVAVPETEPYNPPETPAVDTQEPQPSGLTPASTWRSGVAGRGRRLWTAALAAALVVSLGGIGLLYLDDTNNQATIRDLTNKNESLTGQNQNLGDQLQVTQGQLTVSRQQVTDLTAKLAHPTLETWNVTQKLTSPNQYLAVTVPDTFTFHLKLTATGPMNVSILSTQDFSAALNCFNNGGGTVDYCMHHSGAARGFLHVTSVNTDFTLAEGCAGYLAIITAPNPVTITPDVSVTYNPASTATGACNQG